MSDQLSLASLESLYTFDPAEIGPFLHAHPFLVPLLEEAHAHLREFFPDEHCTLHLSLDEELEVLIHTSQAVTAVLDNLEALDAAWWLDNAFRAQGRMMIYHEFD